jgi:hypothetical protein
VAAEEVLKVLAAKLADHRLAFRDYEGGGDARAIS